MGEEDDDGERVGSGVSVAPLEGKAKEKGRRTVEEVLEFVVLVVELLWFCTTGITALS